MFVIEFSLRFFAFVIFVILFNENEFLHIAFLLKISKLVT